MEQFGFEIMQQFWHGFQKPNCTIAFDLMHNFELHFQCQYQHDLQIIQVSNGDLLLVSWTDQEEWWPMYYFITNSNDTWELILISNHILVPSPIPNNVPHCSSRPHPHLKSLVIPPTWVLSANLKSELVKRVYDFKSCMSRAVWSCPSPVFSIFWEDW